MSTRNAPRSRGFTITEMVACLLLLGVFAYASTRLFVDSHNLDLLALRASASIERLDNALHSLRRDIWNAVTFETPSEHELQITQHPNTHITWTVSSTGDLTRTQSTPAAPKTQSWAQLPPIRLSAKNRTLFLLITDDNQTQSMVLTSQVTPPEAAK